MTKGISDRLNFEHVDLRFSAWCMPRVHLDASTLPAKDFHRRDPRGSVPAYACTMYSTNLGIMAVVHAEVHHLD